MEPTSEANTPFPKPLPLEDADQQPYWDAANRHELALEKCMSCGAFVHPPGPGCPWCGRDEFSWISLGSEIEGTVYSFIVVHRAFLQSFIEDVPYVVALVDVDKAPGIRITGNVVGSASDEVEIGMRVRMFWEDRAPGHTIPQWRSV